MENWISFRNKDDEFGWMGNMVSVPVKHNGVIYKSTEYLFMLMRLDDPDGSKAKALETMNGFKAKKYTKKMIKEGKWKWKHKLQSEQDVKNMEICVELKLNQHPELLEKLLSTDDLPIYEDVTKRCSSKDSSLFWGAAYICFDREDTESMWVGNNQLGRIYMKLREKFRKTL